MFQVKQISIRWVVVSLKCLWGEHPFKGDHFAQLFEQHLRKPAPTIIELVPTCPPELSEVISKLLAKSPEDRPFNARQVQTSMLQLDESIECLEEGKPQEDDVSAADTTLRGNKLLQQEIEQQFGIHSREIGWKKDRNHLGRVGHSDCACHHATSLRQIDGFSRNRAQSLTRYTGFLLSCCELLDLSIRLESVNLI